MPLGYLTAPAATATTFPVIDGERFAAPHAFVFVNLVERHPSGKPEYAWGVRSSPPRRRPDPGPDPTPKRGRYVALSRQNARLTILNRVCVRS